MSMFKPMLIQSALFGITLDQYEAYHEYVSQAVKDKLDYIDDIQEFLDKSQQEYANWFDEEATYEELFKHEILCGQNGVNINEEIRHCFMYDVKEFDAYNY